MKGGEKERAAMRRKIILTRNGLLLEVDSLEVGYRWEVLSCCSIAFLEEAGAHLDSI